MRPILTLLQLIVGLTSLAPVTSAWPEWLPDADALVVRRDTTTSDGPQQTGTVTKEDSDSTVTEAPKDKETGKDDDEDASKTSVNLNTAKVETGTAKGNNSEPTHTTFDVNDPAGGVSIKTPATTAEPTPLFMIGNYVTFGWNYTSLQGTPTAIDVLVSCSVATETWTLTANMTFETDVTFVWNSEEQENDVEAPLLTEMYTLIIKDSDAEITDIPDPGYLGAYSGLKFGMYKNQPYENLTDWECTGCNAASSDIDRRAIGFVFTMSLVTFLSFTWFVTGLGLQ